MDLFLFTRPSKHSWMLSYIFVSSVIALFSLKYLSRTRLSIWAGLYSWLSHSSMSRYLSLNQSISVRYSCSSESQLGRSILCLWANFLSFECFTIQNLAFSNRLLIWFWAQVISQCKGTEYMELFLDIGTVDFFVGLLDLQQAHHRYVQMLQLLILLVQAQGASQSWERRVGCQTGNCGELVFVLGACLRSELLKRVHLILQLDNTCYGYP